MSLLFLFVFQSLLGCGDFLISNKEFTVNGRSMEFAIDLKSALISHHQGESFQSSAPNGQKGLSWTSKYGYVAVIPFGKDTPVDGLNEKGLSFGALWLTDSTYMDVTDSKKALDLQDFGNWILGNFATVKELKEGLKEIEVWSSVNSSIGMVPPIHISVHDTDGQSLVIEFLHGAMTIHENHLGVLTNAPGFEWHLHNLKNYLHLTPSHVKSLDLKGLSLSPHGSGGGLLGLPGDWSSPSRFVKLFFMRHFAKQPENSDQAVNLAFHLLNALDIPRGLVEWNGVAADYTQWVIVKDLLNKKLFFRTYENQTVKMVDVAQELNKTSSLKVAMDS